MTESWLTYPDWFQGAWVEGLQYAPHNQALLESLLGVGRLLSEGRLEDATGLYRKYIFPLITAERMGCAGPQETDSTQLQKMVESGLYPPNLCDEIQQIFHW